MKISIDVVIANCSISLDELNHLQSDQIKVIDNFVQSEVLLKSGNELIATGTLIKVDSDFAVLIKNINSIQTDN